MKLNYIKVHTTLKNIITLCIDINILILIKYSNKNVIIKLIK